MPAVDKPKLYLAGPLFSQAEREFNIWLKKILSEYFTVYLPQEDGGLMVEMIGQGSSPVEASKQVFLGDLKAMQSCDLLLAILDGRVIDEGVCFEIGYCYAFKKPCYGLQTDPRRLFPSGNNPMIENALMKILFDKNEIVKWAKNYHHQTN